MSADDRWGCPDWRDIAAYPKTSDDLEDWEWRWQFLRRLPDYRELYFSLPKMPSLDPDLEFEPDDHCRGIGTAVTDPAFQHVIWTEYNTRVIWNPTLERLDKNPFGLNLGGELFSIPDRSYWEPNEFNYGGPKHRLEFLISSLEAVGLTEGSPTYFAYVCFDISRPISPQLEKAKTDLERLAFMKRAPRLKGKDCELWPRHLRVIDAEDQGATDTEIINQFLSELKNDLVAYDGFADIDQPLVMIADWRKAARVTMEKAARYL